MMQTSAKNLQKDWLPDSLWEEIMTLCPGRFDTSTQDIAIDHDQFKYSCKMMVSIYPIFVN